MSEFTKKMSSVVKDSKRSSVLVPHVIVRARAGTGKTTTLVEGLKIVRGLPVSIIPSDQQKIVWDQMASSKDARSVCFVAFNKSIADELKARVPVGCEAMTLHSLGLKAVTSRFGRVQVDQYRVVELLVKLVNSIRRSKTENELAEESNNYCPLEDDESRTLDNLILWFRERISVASDMDIDSRVLRKYLPELTRAVQDLVRLCKLNLVEPTPGNLNQLASYYDVDMLDSRGQRIADIVFSLVPDLLDSCKEVDIDKKIDFDDMVWLPVVLGMNPFRYDLLLVDEAQDLNRCQQELAKKCGKRMIFVGDDRQAIYAFAGADSNSISRLKEDLERTPSGCVEIPLTKTRRCGKMIVAEANAYVPDFESFDDAPDGEVSTALYPLQKKVGGGLEELPFNQTYMALVEEGDMVVCRANAPLVSQCLRFLKRGIKASIIGRDVGKGLLSLIEKLAAYTIPDLVARLDDWAAKEVENEQAKRNPSESKIINIRDKQDCLLAFIEDADSVYAVKERIEKVFSEDGGYGIRLSSIHKAKGLEAEQVFFLRPPAAPCPHPMAQSDWQYGQELNLCYVAITRAKSRLVYVS